MGDNKSKYYTMEEVKKHNAKSSTHWIVIDNKVYDVTPFLPEHPGKIGSALDLVFLLN
jgi:cytochrome b involved in lipid metabolism